MIPRIDEADDASFLRGFLHHVHCGLLRELFVYTKGRPDAPRPTPLGPGVPDGGCGTIKRFIQDQGSVRIRDWCVRAKVTAKERHMPVDSEPSIVMQELVEKVVAANVESIAERKVRLAALKLEMHKKHARWHRKRSRAGRNGRLT